MASAVAVSKPLQDISTFLDNYWSRDQVFRTLQYASTLCSGLLEPRTPRAASKFTTLASSISTMRTTLRLLDDIPNLVQTLNRLRQQKVSLLRIFTRYERALRII
jgi:tRNA U34 5-methylaminomethyl-2-thiouridine-forming methyltransferase MnmC